MNEPTATRLTLARETIRALSVPMQLGTKLPPSNGYSCKICKLPTRG